ncbi:ribonuclease H-like domain, reverse transcriptase, RNA-dependent DNA polymerase [Tanacetum coccineum]
MSSNKTEMGTMGMVFLSFYFCILFLSVDGNGEPSAYEVLKSYNIPIGVLPKGALGYILDCNSVLQSYNLPVGVLPAGVAGYTLDSTSGQFWVNLTNECNFNEGGHKIKYESMITGVITQNNLGDLDGVKNEHGSKAYRLFDPTTQRICVSRDVKFKEDEKWDWSKYLDCKNCAWSKPLLKNRRDSILLVGVYVDDLIITGTPKREIDKFKDQMKEIFEMSDLGLLAYYLGIEVTQSGGDISIKQSAYARKILKEAGMLESNETIIPMDPGTRLTKTAEGTMVNSTEYRSLIGCLRYLLHTRPDLKFIL